MWNQIIHTLILRSQYQCMYCSICYWNFMLISMQEIEYVFRKSNCYRLTGFRFCKQFERIPVKGETHQ